MPRVSGDAGAGASTLDIYTRAVPSIAIASTQYSRTVWCVSQCEVTSSRMWSCRARAGTAVMFTTTLDIHSLDIDKISKPKIYLGSLVLKLTFSFGHISQHELYKWSRVHIHFTQKYIQQVCLTLG